MSPSLVDVHEKLAAVDAEELEKRANIAAFEENERYAGRIMGRGFLDELTKLANTSQSGFASDGPERQVGREVRRESSKAGEAATSAMGSVGSLFRSGSGEEGANHMGTAAKKWADKTKGASAPSPSAPPLKATGSPAAMASQFTARAQDSVAAKKQSEMPAGFDAQSKKSDADRAKKPDAAASAEKKPAGSPAVAASNKAETVPGRFGPEAKPVLGSPNPGAITKLPGQSSLAEGAKSGEAKPSGATAAAAPKPTPKPAQPASKPTPAQASGALAKAKPLSAPADTSKLEGAKPAQPLGGAVSSPALAKDTSKLDTPKPPAPAQQAGNFMSAVKAQQPGQIGGAASASIKSQIPKPPTA